MFRPRSLGRLLALAACCVALHAQADPLYGVSVVGSADSAAYGINASGQVVGYLTAGVNHHAFLYNNVSTLDLGTLGGDTSIAWGINDAGQVVGGAQNVSGFQRPFSYAGGTMSDLGTLGGNTGHAAAVDNEGRIVGEADTEAVGPRAFLYAGGTMQDLGTLPSSGESFLYSGANAINDKGVIAGGSSAGEFTPPEPPFHAFVRCCDGTLTDLGTLGGQYSEAFGINDLGEVAGITSTSTFRVDHPFLYSHGVMHDLGTLLPDDSYAEAFDVNNLSQVVGRSSGTVPGGLGFLYEDGAMVALNTLIDPTSGWTVVDAHAINDAQQIAGTACLAGACYAVRLDPLAPVPEPNTAAMLAAGLALVGAAVRRRRT